MTSPATFRQADLNRACKVAEKRGWKVVIQGDTITLLPIDPNAPLPSAPQSESDWQGKLASWRGSR